MVGCACVQQNRDVTTKGKFQEWHMTHGFIFFFFFFFQWEVNSLKKNDSEELALGATL